MSEFDLKDLQDSIIGVPNDLILPEEYNNKTRDNRMITTRKIVDLYSTSRKNNRVYKSTYIALSDVNPYVRIAAADVIGLSGNLNSFDHLFKALEDEDVAYVRAKIVSAIDSLEVKLSNNTQGEEKGNSFMKAMRILSYEQ
ncbi:MAG: HEAT repeat domain-containing protein [Candidatus Kariarchaeaceae archaeon]|jgi:hypothetical protein